MRFFNFKLTLKKFPLALFNQELVSLLGAGLSVVTAIETLSAKEKNTEVKSVISNILISLHEGKTFSQALERVPKHFPSLYIATIRASERTGSLIESLKRYLAYQNQVDFIRNKVVSASIYPFMLIGVGSLVVLFLMTYVVPKFSHIYADTGHEMPLASKILIVLGAFIEGHGAAILIGFFILVLLVGYGFSTVYFRAWLNDLLWKTPVLGDRMRVYQLTRLYRTFGMLTNAGIPIVTALEQLKNLLNVRMQVNLIASIKLVKEGMPLSVALESNGLTTAIASRLLQVGEQTGQVGTMMDRVADFHEEELSRWIEIATRLLEPVLMTFMGVIIGGIVVLMYIPIFELAGSIQ